MDLVPTSISDVVVIQPNIHRDDRGHFLEAYQASRYKESGIDVRFVQDNLVGSERQVLRGLHYQLEKPQGKLVQIVCGRVYDVCVDLRKTSPTFGQWVGVELEEKKKQQIWIPPGFAHGYYTLSEWAEVHYKVSEFYDPSSERTLIWNDPQVGIDWPLIDGRSPTLSAKDQVGQSIHELDLFE